MQRAVDPADELSRFFFPEDLKGEGAASLRSGNDEVIAPWSGTTTNW
jgi:hypothetical protein